MSLDRYCDGASGAYEDPNGDYLRLDEVIELLKVLEAKAISQFNDSDGHESHIGNRYSGIIIGIQRSIEAIKGEQK